jgi:hypothetical protein
MKQGNTVRLLMQTLKPCIVAPAGLMAGLALLWVVLALRCLRNQYSRMPPRYRRKRPHRDAFLGVRTNQQIIITSTRQYIRIATVITEGDVRILMLEILIHRLSMMQELANLIATDA